MTAESSATQEGPTLRAPQVDGGWLVEPTPEAAARAARSDRSAPDEAACGFAFEAVSDAARRDVSSAAWQYTRRYRDVTELESRRGPLLLAGHQPTLFHPGVWFKNGVLDRLARVCDGVPINLLVDNDLCSSTSLRVPVGTLEAPHLESIPLDRSAEAIPFEKRFVSDESLFASAAARVRERMPTWIPDPLIDSLWQGLDPSAVDEPLGQRLAIARHRFESRFGWSTLEVPLSRVCESWSFRVFSAALWTAAPRLRDDYNNALWEHRRRYRIRSRSHPVPQLDLEGDWIESPFWVWQDADPRRRRLFVRSHADGRLELTDRKLWRWSGTAEAWIDGAAADGREGVSIRSRALTTTWFARSLLGCAFVHGIGGAHYDRLTDRIIQAHWSWSPPPFVTATATVRLEVPRPGTTEAEAGELKQALRALRFHPERTIEKDARRADRFRDLLDRKLAWTELSRSPLTADERRQRHVDIEQVNRALQEAVEPEREALRQAVARHEREHRIDRVLGSREFSLAIFSQKQLERIYRTALEQAFG